VTRKLFDHDRCYFFQGRDGRIIFAIPYETDFTLIGTTDVEHPDPSVPPVCTPEEQDYLCAFASEYFARPVTRDDIVWTYSGVRPLHDDSDGTISATAASRDYTLKLDGTAGAPVLHVFGGKITTYRRLAEAALDRIGPALGHARGPGRPAFRCRGATFLWTAPGGSRQTCGGRIPSCPNPGPCASCAPTGRRLGRSWTAPAGRPIWGRSSAPH
jgi:glycerol-3-phosphate dehydrogenase